MRLNARLEIEIPEGTLQIDIPGKANFFQLSYNWKSTICQVFPKYPNKSSIRGRIHFQRKRYRLVFGLFLK